VNIEEIKSDIRDLDKELAEKKGVLTKLEADIVDLEADLAKKKLRVPTLQAQLDSLKQASGRTERPESTATDTTRTMSGSGF
jgi:chromosome segregation ATPase